MRVLLQRVMRAAVHVEGREVGAVGHGLLALVCALKGDTADEARQLAAKVARWRCFGDAEGRMNLDVTQVGGAVLVVSQFTLAADGTRGHRPSFDRAAEPVVASALVETFRAELEALGVPTASGQFGARMQVELLNDGPATFLLERAPSAAPT
ncbi:MAG TPA: D-aminoacyl-tRNA deacylase [Planctomycetota bacterium]|nr:D-aminoacyl-tRNA deacylase [Planctomycetota bacterium]